MDVQEIIKTVSISHIFQRSSAEKLEKSLGSRLNFLIASIRRLTKVSIEIVKFESINTDKFILSKYCLDPT